MLNRQDPVKLALCSFFFFVAFIVQNLYSIWLFIQSDEDCFDFYTCTLSFAGIFG